MEIIIKNSQNFNLYPFCRYLISQIRYLTTQCINNKKIAKFNDIINKHIQYKIKDNKKRKIKAKDILIIAAYNLKISRNSHDYIIYLDNNICLPNTYSKIAPLVKCINYGTLNISPYPIFDEILKYISDHLILFMKKFQEDK